MIEPMLSCTSFLRDIRADTFAEHALKHRTRRMAPTEAFEVYLPVELLEAFLKLGVDLFFRDLDLEALFNGRNLFKLEPDGRCLGHQRDPSVCAF